MDLTLFDTRLIELANNCCVCSENQNLNRERTVRSIPHYKDFQLPDYQFRGDHAKNSYRARKRKPRSLQWVNTNVNVIVVN